MPKPARLNPERKGKKDVRKMPHVKQRVIEKSGKQRRTESTKKDKDK
jgi:hypothetical protein